jgi:hypothetical protein
VGSFEFVRKDFFLFSATVALANKRFEILKRFVSWAMLWCCSHDKSPPPDSESVVPHLMALRENHLLHYKSLASHLLKVQGKYPKKLQEMNH